jgi:ribosomal protein L37E
VAESLIPGMDDVQVMEDIDLLGSLEHTIKRLRAQLERLQAAGGTDALVGYRNALLGQLASIYNALGEPIAPYTERLKVVAAMGSAARAAPDRCRRCGRVAPRFANDFDAWCPLCGIGQRNESLAKPSR